MQNIDAYPTGNVSKYIAGRNIRMSFWFFKTPQTLLYSVTWLFLNYYRVLETKSIIVSDYFGIMMIMYYIWNVTMPWNNIAGHNIQMSSALIWQSGKPKILQRFSKIISKYQRVWWYIIFDDLGLYIQLELDKKHWRTYYGDILNGRPGTSVYMIIW